MTDAKETPHPPGTAPGGIWGKNTYIGSQTQAAACIGCLCFCLPGLCILFCPWDERDAYKVDGKVYDAAGTLIGPAEKAKFVASGPMQR